MPKRGKPITMTEAEEKRIFSYMTGFFEQYIPTSRGNNHVKSQQGSYSCCTDIRNHNPWSVCRPCPVTTCGMIFVDHASILWIEWGHLKVEKYKPLQMSIDTSMCSQQLASTNICCSEVMDDICEPVKRKFDSSYPEVLCTQMRNLQICWRKIWMKNNRRRRKKGKKGSDREEEIGKEVARREKTKRERTTGEKEEQKSCGIIVLSL